MDIESKLWRVTSTNTAQVAIIQKASGAVRYVGRSALPSTESMAAMHERAFDRHAREAFHGEK